MPEDICIGHGPPQDSMSRLMAIQDFTATLAHDLMVPFLGARTLLQGLLTEKFGQLTAEQVKVLVELKESNGDQISLVQKLMEVYRYESDGASLSTQNIKIVHLIDEAIFKAKRSAKTMVEFERLLATDIPDFEGDGEAIRELFDNLIDNAVKYGGEGRITITLAYMETNLVVRIHNWGKPMDPEIQKNMSRKFWQGIPGKHYVAHTGLGLYLCSRIVDLHGGSLICKSDAETGTTISVVLPLGS